MWSKQIEGWPYGAASPFIFREKNNTYYERETTD